MANRFFVGDVDADWNDAGNWSAASGGAGGAGVPIAGDDAIFDGGSPDCNADANLTPDNIALAAGFAGTLDLVTFNATLAGGISIAAGTMLAGSGTVSVLGSVTMTGGTLNGESGTIRFHTTWNTGGGTWLPGTGTVQAWAVAGYLAQQITGATTFNNLTVGQTAPGANCTLTLTGTVTVNGTLDLQGYAVGGFQRFLTGGQISARGNVNNSNNISYYGTCLLYIDGAGNQTIYARGGLSITVAKAGGWCRFGTFRADTYFHALTFTFDASVDWATLGMTSAMLLYGLNITFVPTGGLAVLAVSDFYMRAYNYAAAATLDLGGLVFNVTGNCTCILAHGLSNRRINTGRVDVAGNLTVDIADNGAFTGSAIFRMVGAVNRTINFSGRGQDRYWNPLEIQKTLGATVTLIDALGTRGAGQNITVNSGTLDLGGFSITAGGAFAVAAGATLRARGDSVITAVTRTYNAASNVVLYNNAVTALLNNLGLAFGNLDLGPGGKTINTTFGTAIGIAGTLAASGGSLANPVLIRSTMPGVQAAWTLTGVSALGDRVNVRDNDASGGATIMALGSVDAGNTLNWFFYYGGGRHPRASKVRAYPEGFTGGLSPRDFMGYSAGMPGMGGAGSSAALPPTPMTARVLLAGALGAGGLRAATLNLGASWTAGGMVAADGYRDAARSASWWFVLRPTGLVTPVEVLRAPTPDGGYITVPLPGTSANAGGLHTKTLQLGTGGQLFALAYAALPVAGTYLYRSLDHGASWTQGANPVHAGVFYYPSWVYRTYSGALLSRDNALNARRSADLGDTWADAAMPINMNAPIMVGQRQAGARIYGLTSGYGALAGLVVIVYSDDDGASWAGFVPAGLGGMTITGQAWLTVTQSGALLALAQDAGASQCIFRSTDGGNNWTARYTPPAGYAPVKLRQCADAHGTLIAGLAHGLNPRLIYSTDDGVTWFNSAGFIVPPDNLTVQALAADYERIS